jgi:DNA repair exonuclease SbcCD ATPase subunit
MSQAPPTTTPSSAADASSGPPAPAAASSAAAKQRQQDLQNQQQDLQEEDNKTDEEKLKEQVEPIIKTYVDLQRELTTLRIASPPTSDTDWTAFGAKVDAASSALKIVATAVNKYKSTAPTNTDESETVQEISSKMKALKEEIDNLEDQGKSVPDNLRKNLTALRVKFEEKTTNNTSAAPKLNQTDLDSIIDQSLTAVGRKSDINPTNGGSSSSSSKKNRKSHKSYHPGIGKTRKHHSHDDHKRVSFVHQA